MVTEMAFRQAIGRVVRIEPDHEQPTAYVYLPDDQRLRRYASKIHDQVLAHLIEENEDEADLQLNLLNVKEQSTEASIRCFESRSATHTREGIIAGRNGYSIGEFTRAEQVVGLLPRETQRVLDAHMMVTILRAAAGVMPEFSGHSSGPDLENRPTLLRARLRRMRKEQFKLIVAIARAERLGSGEDAYRRVNLELNLAAGIESVTTCYDVELLIRRGRLARERLQRATAGVRA
jgi:hypothetical protein